LPVQTSVGLEKKTLHQRISLLIYFHKRPEMKYLRTLCFLDLIIITILQYHCQTTVCQITSKPTSKMYNKKYLADKYSLLCFVFLHHATIYTDNMILVSRDITQTVTSWLMETTDTLMKNIMQNIHKY